MQNTQASWVLPTNLLNKDAYKTYGEQYSDNNTTKFVKSNLPAEGGGNSVTTFSIVDAAPNTNFYGVIHFTVDTDENGTKIKKDIKNYLAISDGDNTSYKLFSIDE